MQYDDDTSLFLRDENNVL